MKIHDAGRVSQALTTYGKNGGRVREGQAGVNAPGQQRDGVSFSREALDMARELQGTPERAAHLAALKQEIQSGTYHVEPDAVVRKMLAAYGEY